MKKIILALALVAGLTSFAGNAKAQQQFAFSFTGNTTPGGPFYTDTIQGILTLNSQGTAATSVYVTNDIGGNVNVLSYNFNEFVNANSFTVSNIGGVPTIIAGQYNGYAGNGADGLSLNYVGSGSQVYVSEYVIAGAIVLNEISISTGIGGTTFSAVPEPSTYALFGLGTLALIIAYRRKVA